MTSVIISKKSMLLKALKSGEKLTSKQITDRFGIANPTATVSDLRFDGFAIYGNPTLGESGKKIITYRLGTPSREIVAAGIRALADKGISI